MTPATITDARETLDRAEVSWLRHGGSFRRAVEIAAEGVARERKLSAVELARMATEELTSEEVTP